MLANNNLKVCRTLIFRDFKFHRVKMLMLVLSAVLVTALYTFLFLLGGSIKGGFLLNYLYQYGSTSQILYTGMNEHQADAIAGNADVKSSVRISTIGWLSDPMIGQRRVKLAVTDREYAETVLSVPTSGRLPEQPGEIALDEFTMNSLGVLHEEGAPVTLQWTDAAGKEQISEFTLCGWWVSSTNFSEACAWITAETAGMLAPGYDAESAHNITLGVNLYQPGDLEIQAAALLEETGVSGADFTTNLVYNDARREAAAEKARPYYLLTLLVLLCGYLMIYVIVHAASWRDTFFYTEIKSLGMSPRQFRYLLLEQGAAVSFLGLIPGWLLGFLLHLGITSRMITGMEENPALYFLTWQPFLVAAVCTVTTTLLAYLLPALKLSAMTPAQMLQYQEEKIAKKGQKSGGRTTLVSLALRTLGRNRMRMVWSACTLLLAALLLNAVWIQYLSIKEDLYLSGMSPWDYSITDGSAYFSAQIYNEKNQSVTEEMVTDLRERQEVTAVSRLKTKEIMLTAPDELRRRVIDYYNQPYDETMTLKESQEGFPEWIEGLEQLEQTGEYTALIIGIDGAYLEYMLEYSPFTSGSFEEKKFAEGHYVLAGGAYFKGISTPAEGEQIELNGEAFEVMGSVMHDDSYLSGSGSKEAAFHISYLVPVEVFDRLFPGQSYRQLAVDIDHSRQAEFEDYLDQYEKGLNRGVGITTRGEYQTYFESARLNEVLPELVVALAMAVIALINFANMLVVKTVSRRAEFAVYESLGMTGGQLRALLFLEGAFHAAVMAVVLVPATILFNRFLMPKVVEAAASWAMIYTFSVTALWLFLAVVVLLGIAVPLLCLRAVAGGSLTERMRKPE